MQRIEVGGCQDGLKLPNSAGSRYPTTTLVLLWLKLLEREDSCTRQVDRRGGSRNFRKGGPGSQILERGGGGMRLFSASLSHFFL